MLKTLVTIFLIFLIPVLCDAKDLSQSLTYALQTKVRLIVIDPGFGGGKTGPSGCDDSLFAKNINLQIAKKVAARIEKDLAIKVILTRENDTYISLKQRATLANTEKADLLISIHTNGSKYSSASGVETYLLNLTSNPDVIKTAAKANVANLKTIAEKDYILQDLMQNSKVNESKLLAKNVQKYLIKQLKKKNKTLRNRGIKKAPFYILLGAEMPAIIVQAGFITNPDECRLLNSDAYQEQVSIGIVKGIRAFINERLTQQP